MDSTPALNSMTCNNCGRKLAEIKIKEGVISIKCPKCGVVNKQESKTPTAKERQ